MRGRKCSCSVALSSSEPWLVQYHGVALIFKLLGVLTAFKDSPPHERAFLQHPRAPRARMSASHNLTQSRREVRGEESCGIETDSPGMPRSWWLWRAPPSGRGGMGLSAGTPSKPSEQAEPAAMPSAQRAVYFIAPLARLRCGEGRWLPAPGLGSWVLFSLLPVTSLQPFLHLTGKGHNRAGGSQSRMDLGGRAGRRDGGTWRLSRAPVAQ